MYLVNASWEMDYSKSTGCLGWEPQRPSPWVDVCGLDRVFWQGPAHSDPSSSEGLRPTSGLKCGMLWKLLTLGQAGPDSLLFMEEWLNLVNHWGRETEAGGSYLFGEEQV